LAKTTVDLLIDREKSRCTNHDTTTTTTTTTSSVANNDDNMQISFHLNDNYDNEMTPSGVTGANNQHSLTYDQQAPSVGSVHNFDYNNSNVPSVGKAVNDNSINNDGSSIGSGSSTNPNMATNGDPMGMSSTAVAVPTTDHPQSSQHTDSECPSCDSSFEMNVYKPCAEPKGIWLIAPLIGKLQDPCHSKVLEYASNTLQELGKSFWMAKTKNEKETQALKNLTAWSQQPFFALLLSCIKCQEEQRPLLTSLFNQITEFIGKEDKLLADDPRIKQIMMQTLHIRLSLVGSMFDFILVIFSCLTKR
jgi:hypothetical protein